MCRKIELAENLESTARTLRQGAPYRWTHQGRCNLGHLIQTVTGLEAAHIHRVATQAEGEWLDHAANYCATSGLAVDSLIERVLALGLTLDEVADVERLASNRVLRWLPAGRRTLDYRQRQDVVLYFETWAQVLRAEVGWAQAPDDAMSVNGREYTPDPRATRIAAALDENPAAGRAA